MRRVLGFVLATGIAAISSLATIPIVVGFAGVTGWATVAVAQTVGLLGQVLVSWGWNTIGPAAIAQSMNRRELLARSVRVRVCVSFVVGPLIAVLAYALQPSVGAASVLIALGFAVGGFGFSWAYIGLRKPWNLVLFDALPRASSIILGAFALAVAPLEVYGLLVMLGYSLSSIASFRDLRRGHPNTEAADPLRIREQIGFTSSGVVNDLAAAAYFYLPTLMVSYFAPLDVHKFALAERIQRLAKSAIMPLAQAAQGWVFSASAIERALRIKQILALFSVLAIASGVIAYACFSLISDLLTSGAINAGGPLSTPFSLVLSFGTLSMATGLVALFALGQGRHVAASAILGACFGGIALAYGTVGFGGVGAAWAAVIAEIVVLIYQLVKLISLRKALVVHRGVN